MNLTGSEINTEKCIRSLRYDDLNVQDFDVCWQACSNFGINEINQLSFL